MGNYSIKDFRIGDKVHHLSNLRLPMVVIKINPDVNEVICRWIDNNGTIKDVGFMPEELGKASDLNPKISKGYFLP